MKRLYVPLVALMLVLGVTAPAAAAKPVVEVFWEGPFGPEPVEFDFADCGFPVEWVGRTEVYKRVWFDEDDFPIKAELREIGTATYYNALADQMTVSEQWSWVLHEDSFRIEGDALVWDQRLTGKNWGIKLPKGGPIIHVAGQQWSSASWLDEPEPTESLLRQVGRHLWDEDAFCDALTPPE